MNNPENSAVYSVPRLKRGKSSPASVDWISLTHSGDRTQLLIKIKRNLEIPLEEFTFKYRFSPLTRNPEDKRPFRSFIYAGDDINTGEILSFDAAIPPGTDTKTCTAFVSEVKHKGGDAVGFEPSDFIELQFVEYKLDESEFADSMPFRTEQAKLLTPEPSPVDTKPKRVRFVIPIIIGVAALAAAGIFAGKFALNKDTEKSAFALAEQSRYAEAYKLALDSGNINLLRDVCREASDYYLGNGDFEQAYLFAGAAPEPYVGEVATEAALNIVDKSTGTVSVGAYRVILYTSDDDLLAKALHSAIDTFAGKGDYISALRTAGELPDASDRVGSLRAVFGEAITVLLDNSDFGRFEAFLNDIKVNQIYDYSDSDLINALTAYRDAHAGSSTLLYLAARYPGIIDISAADITVGQEDAAVRSALGSIWPLLTPEQKRIYHSRRIAVDKALYRIDGGAVSGIEITDAISIDTCGGNTIILRADGSVVSTDAKTDLSKQKDVVQIAAGLNHSIFLHSDGTVSAVGDNSYSQCNVGDWKDIVAVAAGQNFTVGLKLDGSLVACGSNSCGQCEVSDINGAVAIAAGGQTTAILFADRSVRLRGYRSLGLTNAELLNGVVSIRVGDAAVLAETFDGRYELFAGSESGSFGDPSGWTEIDCFDVGSLCIAAVGGDGAVYADGEGVSVK